LGHQYTESGVGAGNRTNSSSSSFGAHFQPGETNGKIGEFLVGGNSSLSSQKYAAEIQELRQRNQDLRTQLTEAPSRNVDKEQELDEDHKDNPSLDVKRMVQLLRKAELTDSKIVPIINKLFAPPAGHENWTKLLLPKED
jgi:hypothetical protein